MSDPLRALTENSVRTSPDDPDRRLLGRTYAIPFEDVWQACLALTGGLLRGWHIVRADDQSGRIQALSRPLLFGPPTDIWVEIGLDDNGQTRVDLQAGSQTERGDLGRSRRAVGGFLRRLDRHLNVAPEQVLDPASLPRWTQAL